jgi:hypothetical protein
MTWHLGAVYPSVVPVLLLRLFLSILAQSLPCDNPDCWQYSWQQLQQHGAAHVHIVALNRRPGVAVIIAHLAPVVTCTCRLLPHSKPSRPQS